MKAGNQQKHNQIFGRWGEDQAADFLLQRGYTILGRNIRTPEGEIDLIVRKNEIVVFVEVKARSHSQNGYPEEAITEEKMEHMLNSAEHYLLEHPELEENWRVDVISVTGRPNEMNPQIEWFEDAA